MAYSLILADAVTTVSRVSIGLRGERIERGPTATMLAAYDFPVEVFVALLGTSGQTVTFQPQVAPKSLAWASWGSAVTLTIPSTNTPQAWKSVGRLTGPNDYLALNITAITGTLNAYVRRMG